MNRSAESKWSELIIESGAHPSTLSEERFREWMTGRAVFISSLMDDEMRPFREAVRAYLHRIGSLPVMWEEITPRDEQPQSAYLGGVDRSSAFLLLLGSRYGAADSTGYSPTHQEGNRAAESRKPRLLFVLETVKDSERDGRLNDWLRSLYNELSGGTFTSATDLVAQLDARLREMAAQNERVWIKLGRIIFPGAVTSRFEGNNGGQFIVTARVGDGRVRRALVELGQPFSRSDANRLTWADKSFPIRIESVAIETEFTAEDVVRITCGTPQNWQGGTGSNISMMFSVGTATASELASVWARRALLGEHYEGGTTRGLDLTRSFSEPDAPTLPEVLRESGASGWLAEGLTRLYAVEELNRRYGAHFEYLEIGPAISAGLRIEGAFGLNLGMGSRQDQVQVGGFVPLR
jgi:hypothetical protein